tara:strand:+ start:1132 stop:1467 length:336 start_codon:yes stop_codon:yes gene_type:complete
MNFDETSAHEARQQGRQAYYDGQGPFQTLDDLDDNVLDLQRAWVAGWFEAKRDDVSMPGLSNLCSCSEDGKHKPHGVSGPVDTYEDLVVDITCLHCGASGSITIDTEDVLW